MKSHDKSNIRLTSACVNPGSHHMYNYKIRQEQIKKISGEGKVKKYRFFKFQLAFFPSPMQLTCDQLSNLFRVRTCLTNEIQKGRKFLVEWQWAEVSRQCDSAKEQHILETCKKLIKIKKIEFQEWDL